MSDFGDDSALRYRYDFDPLGDSVAARALRMVGGKVRVLELGCAAGSMTRVMQEHYGCRVTAFERDAQAATEARPWCERLLVGDLDRPGWSAPLEDACFDVVLAADVIEHLRDPLACLRELRARLGPGGRLVLSVPNVGYMGVIASLLADEFEYRDTGLLDHTHLRFFTWTSLERLLHAAGFAALRREAVETEACHGDFSRFWSRLPAVLQQQLASLPQARAYQYVVLAQPTDAPVALSVEIAKVPPHWPASTAAGADPVAAKPACRAVPATERSQPERTLWQRFVALLQR